MNQIDRKTIILLILILGTPIFGFSQFSTKYVVDAHTMQPVSDAHVIVTNSSISTYTDLNGQFEIDLKKAQGLNIIFSHINYELQTFDFVLGSEMPDTFFLEPAVLNLDEITIRANKSNLKKKRLKQFRNDLFKSDDLNINRFAKRSQLLNPEDLIFVARNDSLMASSRKLLSLYNPYLGYDVLLLLNDYSKYEDLTTFSGKATFSEAITENNRKARFLRRRNKVWSASFQAFTGSLLSFTTKDSKYKLYSFSPDTPNPEFQALNNIDLAKILYKTTLEDVYALVLKNALRVEYDDKASNLKSTSGLILFNSQGTILNLNEVILEGYWARLSINELIPNDFRKFDFENFPIANFKKSYSISELRNIAKQGQNQGLFIQDIVFETDRLLYSASETVFISGSLIDHNSQELIQNDEIVHLELVDPKGQRIAYRVALAQEGSFKSSFELNSELEIGQYLLRAYTDYMQNYPESSFPGLIIGVGMIKATESLSSEVFDSIIIDFHVEGGNLVYGKENKIIWYAKDKSNKPVEFSGFLKDEIHGKIYPIQTLQKGIGILSLTPDENANFSVMSDTYKVNVSNPEILIPSNSTSISINNRNQDFIQIQLLSNNHLSDLFLLIKMRNKVVYSMSDLQIGEVYKLSKDFLPKSILQLLLVNAEGDVISKRMIDNRLPNPQFISVDFEYPFIFTKQDGSLDIFLNPFTGENADSLKWNLKIVHQAYSREIPVSSVNFLENSFSIQRDEGDLSESNFNEIRNYEMISRTLPTRYNEVYNVSDITTSRRNTQSLNGILVSPENKEPIQGTVLLSSLTSDFYYDYVVSDENGRFHFENIPFFQNGNVIIQARRGILDENSFTQGNRNILILIDSIQVEKDLSHLPFKYRDDLIEPTTENILAYASNKNTDQNLLDEVTISASRFNVRNRSNTISIANRKDVHDESSGIALLSTIFPGNSFRSSPEDPTKLQIYYRGYSGYAWLDLPIAVDGMLQINHLFFTGLIADQIAYIGLYNGFLSVITNPGYQRRSASKDDEKGIINYSFPQNKDETDFNYLNRPDLWEKNFYDDRKTIFWEPKFQFDDSMKKTINFSTSNIPGDYLIRVSTIHPEFGYLLYEFPLKVQEREP